MDIYLTLPKLKLTAAEESAVKTAQAHIAEACRCTAQYGGDPPQNTINELAEKFEAQPTAELATAITAETVMQNSMPALAAMFGGIFVALKAETSKGLIPMARELTARTIAELDKQLSIAVAGLEQIGDMADTNADLRAKHARQLEFANYDCDQLSEPHRDCLSWLVSTFEV